MTKSGFIARLAAFHHLVATDIELAVKTILEAMTQSLVASRRVEVRGFTGTPKKAASRQGTCVAVTGTY